MPAQHSLTSPHVNKRRMINSLYITPKSFKIFLERKRIFFFLALVQKKPLRFKNFVVTVCFIRIFRQDTKQLYAKLNIFKFSH